MDDVYDAEWNKNRPNRRYIRSVYMYARYPTAYEKPNYIPFETFDDPVSSTGPMAEAVLEDDSGKIICTQLFKAGLLSDSIFEADQAFGDLLIVEDPEVMIGYTLWATPVVNLMQKSKMFTRVVYVIAKPWAEQMAYEMGVRTKENLIGKMIMTIGKPFCRLVSKASRVVRAFIVDPFVKENK